MTSGDSGRVGDLTSVFMFVCFLCFSRTWSRWIIREMRIMLFSSGHMCELHVNQIYLHHTCKVFAKLLLQLQRSVKCLLGLFLRQSFIHVPAQTPNAVLQANNTEET